MNDTERLANLRREIDEINSDMTALFLRRMSLSEEIADVKSRTNLPITDENRERLVVETVTAGVPESDKPDVAAFMRTLIALSKSRQSRRLISAEPVDFPVARVDEPHNPVVAFQGVTGAWSETGSRTMFPDARLENREYFDDVFAAVRDGSVRYGVLPIENSQTGAIGEVYDLLRHHGCYIVKEVWITVRQCLLALPGTRLTDIREVFSHPEGFNQSRRFLKNRSWDLTACRNTAYAAQLVAERGFAKYAAIGSRAAAAAHGLTVVAADIMDNPHNRTRFIAIAAEPEYGAESTTTSVTFSTAHRSGALNAVLQCFAVEGINLTRIESRPVSQEKYRFFADLQANVTSDFVRDALRLAAAHCDYFEVLGCYPTVTERSE